MILGHHDFAKLLIAFAQRCDGVIGIGWELDCGVPQAVRHTPFMVHSFDRGSHLMDFGDGTLEGSGNTWHILVLTGHMEPLLINPVLSERGIRVH